jgi:hypothetical protein
MVKNGKSIIGDLSLWGLFLSNVIAIVMALVEGWSLGIIMWVYWCQSVIIGIWWFFKLLTLKEFSTKDFKINDMSVPPTQETKIKTSFFFLVHYGVFHTVYSVFLFNMVKTDRIKPILLLALVFFIYQAFSFFYNRKWDTAEKPNIGKLFLFPYARILPMHLTLILGGILSGGVFESRLTLAIFMILKSMADVVMHIFERTGFAD